MSRLQSSNRNYLEAAERNRTSGRRDTISAQAGGMLTSGGLSHRFTVAGEWSGERFIASDTAFGGFTNQRRERNQAALTAEYRLETGPLLADVALRRDRFSDFTDATTVRVGGLLRLGDGIALAANWGEGIAQPTFFDLYGFFPASFVGNPALKPERSRGGEVSLRYTGGPWRATATLWRQKLQDEIVDRYNPATFLSTTENSAGRSRREGAEVEAGWSAGPGLNLHAQFTLLDATEPAGRELRRPRRSGSVSADGTVGRLTYGAAVAYTGARLDRDFDLFPAPLVRLSPYWLASARIAYEVAAGLEIFGRLANAFDDRVVDVVGYRSEGRTAFAGIRLGLGR
jgi:vitamin B12 transporter